MFYYSFIFEQIFQFLMIVTSCTLTTAAENNTLTPERKLKGTKYLIRHKNKIKYLLRSEKKFQTLIQDEILFNRHTYMSDSV